MASGGGPQRPSYTKEYVSGVAFGEKSTPDYTWDGVFVENKKLETKYLPNDLMNQLNELSEEVSSMWGRINSARSTAENAQTTADKALSMLPTVTSTDSGKFLRVSSTGKWVAEAIASAEGASF